MVKSSWILYFWEIVNRVFEQKLRQVGVHHLCKCILPPPLHAYFVNVENILFWMIFFYLDTYVMPSIRQQRSAVAFELYDYNVIIK